MRTQELEGLTYYRGQAGRLVCALPSERQEKHQRIPAAVLGWVMGLWGGVGSLEAGGFQSMVLYSSERGLPGEQVALLLADAASGLLLTSALVLDTALQGHVPTLGTAARMAG